MKELPSGKSLHEPGFREEAKQQVDAICMNGLNLKREETSEEYRSSKTPKPGQGPPRNTWASVT